MVPLWNARLFEPWLINDQIWILFIANSNLCVGSLVLTCIRRKVSFVTNHLWFVHCLPNTKLTTKSVMSVKGNLRRYNEREYSIRLLPLGLAWLPLPAYSWFCWHGSRTTWYGSQKMCRRDPYQCRNVWLSFRIGKLLKVTCLRLENILK